MYVCHYFCFIVLGFLYPKINKLFGGLHVCDCASHIHFWSHTHFSLIFCFLVFIK